MNAKDPKFAKSKTTKYQERENAKARKTVYYNAKIVSLAVVEEKFNRQISSTAATKTGH